MSKGKLHFARYTGQEPTYGQRTYGTRWKRVDAVEVLCGAVCSIYRASGRKTLTLELDKVTCGNCRRMADRLARVGAPLAPGVTCRCGRLNTHGEPSEADWEPDCPVHGIATDWRATRKR